MGGLRVNVEVKSGVKRGVKRGVKGLVGCCQTLFHAFGFILSGL